MKNIVIVALTLYVIFLSCASGPIGLRNVKEINDVSVVNNGQVITCENAENIFGKYIIDFIVPNPLYGDYGSSSGRIDPNHESTIHCRAVLLNDFSTRADILSKCRVDSLDEGNCEEFRKNYIEKNLRDGMFRIRIEMESGFSEKSMNPSHWAIYLENSSGVMIEPSDITDSSVTTFEDSVYSGYYDRNFPRRLLKRDVTLYFKKTTFFGEDLLSSENPYIILEMSHKKKTVARIAWKISEENKR